MTRGGGGGGVGCELCGSVARIYCESDRASLCWGCDHKVHGANFLVGKHTRTLLCHRCQSPTPWTASGSKIPPSMSLCLACVSLVNSSHPHPQSQPQQPVQLAPPDGQHPNDDDDEEEEQEEGGYGSYGDDDSGDNDDDDGEEDDDDENQVVPWQSSSAKASVSVSGGETEDEDEDEDDDEDDVEDKHGLFSSSSLLKRKRETPCCLHSSDRNTFPRL